MIFNWYSFVLIAVFSLLIAGFILWRIPYGGIFLKSGLWILLLMGVTGAWWFLRPSPLDKEVGLAEVEKKIGNGTPAVLAVYSEY